MLDPELSYYDLVQTSAVIDPDAGMVYYEARIPVPTDLITVQDGMKVGFEVAFTNATTEAEGRVGCVSWSKYGSLIWKWTSPAGTAVLVDDYNHNLVKHEAKDATYEASGNKQYFECTSCGRLYEDADAKVETTLDKVTIPQITTIPVTGINLDAVSVRLINGNDVKLVATVSPENATNKAVEWISSDETVVTVSDGIVSAVGLGSAVITAKTVDGDYAAVCSVYVICEHDLVRKDCAVATCTTKGTETSEGKDYYYYCVACDVMYSNENKDKTVELVSVPVDPSNHSISEHKAVEATYVSAGNILYYECVLCSKLFEDSDCSIETDRSKVVIPQKLQVSSEGTVEIAVDEIVEVAVKDEDTNTVTIPLDNTVDQETGEVVAVTVVTLPVEVVSDASDSNASLELKTADSSIKFDNKALSTIADAVGSNDGSKVELEVQLKAPEEALEEDQVSAVETHNVEEITVVVSASIVVDGKPVGSESDGGFNGGSATISIPFIPAEGSSASDYSILYVPDDGEAVLVDAKYDTASKCLVFTTEHLSEYAIVKIHKCNFSELKLNGVYHWYECTCGEQSEYVKHEYVNKNNNDYHWAECSGCGDIINKSAHRPGAAATETTAQVCADCGFVIANILGHSCEKHLTKIDAVKVDCDTDGSIAYYLCECGRMFKDISAKVEIFNKSELVILSKGHVDSDNDKLCDVCDDVLHTCKFKLKSDAFKHWSECSCGEVMNVAEHIESSWIIDVEPEAFEDGSKHTECVICGFILQAESMDNLGWYDENMFWYTQIVCNKEFTISASATNGGMISDVGDSIVKYGTTKNYIIKPFDGYRIKSVYINGKNIGVLDEYKFNFIRSSTTIHVEFEEIQ